jgi:mannose-1-phosphate guanylyltransferase
LKAVILAGGKGTRARPFTDYFPKAMIPVAQSPLISYIVRYLSSSRLVSEIIIVADIAGLGGQIKNYFESDKKIRFVQDSGNGTAGDLLHLGKMLGKEPFFLWFADNLCAVNLEKMYKHFTKKNSIACVATRQYRKEETGFAKVDNGIVTEFIEKPLVKMQNFECTGIYVIHGKIIDLIKAEFKTKKNINLSFDVLQELSKKGLVSAFDIGNTLWLDVESPITLERNDKTVKKIIKQMNHKA